MKGMRERDATIRERNKVLTETMQSLIQLFEGTSRSEKAAEWRIKLAHVQAAGPRGRPAWPGLSSHDEAAAVHLK